MSETVNKTREGDWHIMVMVYGEMPLKNLRDYLGKLMRIRIGKTNHEAIIHPHKHRSHKHPTLWQNNVMAQTDAVGFVEHCYKTLVVNH